jgi:trimethylamine--corrinoid protein Co-methyltransferase
MVEGTLSVYTQALCGSNLVHDVGFLESGMTSSFEMLVAMDEVIGMVKQIIKPVKINRETLALDVIDQVGPGGNFIAEKHTMDHFREFWVPGLLDRQNYEAWAGEGKPNLGDRIRSKVNNLLSEHNPEPLSANKMADIKALIQAAESRLGISG